MDRKQKNNAIQPLNEGSDTDVQPDLSDSLKPFHSHSQSSSQDEVFFASGPFYAHLDDLDDEEDNDELTVI